MSTSLHSLAKRLAPDHVELSSLRTEVSSWLESTITEDDKAVLIGDIGVVLTELAANAIDHTESEYVSVVLHVDSSAVSIEVANDGDSSSIPEVVGWGSLAEGHRGRGLRLVRALCDDIELAGDERSTIVRCRFRFS